MNHRLMSKPGEAVSQFKGVNDASTRIGGMREDGNPRKLVVCAHATASTAICDRGPPPINGFCEKSQIVSDAAPSPTESRLPCPPRDIGGGDPARGKAGHHLGDMTGSTEIK